jgi:uncharacterized membrane protein YedE/YeeE
MTLIFSLLAGLLFGIGLIFSGMTNPEKVIGFLDVTGKWDPSLLFVMLGAISISFFAFRLASKKSTSIFGQPMNIPTKKEIDLRLIVGSIIFGIGWGLAGYCPGPGITAIATSNLKPITFVIAMLFGMLVYELTQKIQNSNK